MSFTGISWCCSVRCVYVENVGNSMPPCGTPFLNVEYALRHLIMVCGMFVWCSLCVSVCMFTVLNALPMSSVTVIVHSGGLFWLKPVAMVLFYVV